MKKFISLAVGVLCSLNMMTTILAETKPKVVVNGKEIETEAIIKDGRTLIPVRGVFEELGYIVSWDNDTKTAVITNDAYKISIQNGQTTFICNNQTIIPDVPQQNVDSHFYIPLRSIAESISAEVDWNGETKTAIVNTSKKDINIIGEDKTFVGTNPVNGKPIYLVGGCESYTGLNEYSNGILVNGKRIWFDMSYKEAQEAIGMEAVYGDNETWGTFYNTSIGNIKIGEDNGEISSIELSGSEDFDIQYGKYLYTHMNGEEAAKSKLGEETGNVYYSREPGLVITDCSIRDSRGYAYISIDIAPNANSSSIIISKEIYEF